MRAVTVVPLKANTVDLTELPEPPVEDGPILVKTRAVGVCGTDIEIIAGDYGWAPPGEERLALVLSEYPIDDEALRRAIEETRRTGEVWAVQFVLPKTIEVPR